MDNQLQFDIHKQIMIAREHAFDKVLNYLLEWNKHLSNKVQSFEQIKETVIKEADDIALNFYCRDLKKFVAGLK